LGWIISAAVKIPGTKRIQTVVNLEKFWKIKEVSQTKTYNEEEKCTELFKNSTQIDKDGRFLVKSPFIKNKELG